MSRIFTSATFSSALLALSFALAHQPASAMGSSKPKPTPTPAPTPPATEPPQIVQGWLDEYSTHVEGSVLKQYPAMVEVANSRMARLCPKWSTLGSSLRAEFWSSLMWAVAGPESSRNRTLIYVESTMSKDPITGYQVRSEGLLQLSYQDVPNYGYKGDDISWSKDKTMAIQDYDSGTHYGNPKRTILNAYSNLNLGLFIMNKLVVMPSKASKSMEDTLGSYWSTLQTRHTDIFAEVMNNLQSKMPRCFK